jgi:hypothetical protein
MTLSDSAEFTLGIRRSRSHMNEHIYVILIYLQVEDGEMSSGWFIVSIVRLSSEVLLQVI